MKGGIMYDQKDIIIIPFPYSDLTGAKLRPALIVSNGKINKTEDRICCLVTSNKPKDGVLIDSVSSGKLPFKSWVKPHRLFCVNEKIIKKKVCSVTNKFHNKVVSSVKGYLESE